MEKYSFTILIPQIRFSVPCKKKKKLDLHWKIKGQVLVQVYKMLNKVTMNIPFQALVQLMCDSWGNKMSF